MKYIVLIAVLALAWMYWRSKRGHGGPPPGAGGRAAAPPALPEDMVRCPVCALHLPRAEATADAQGRLYCSREHLAVDADKDRR